MAFILPMIGGAAVGGGLTAAGVGTTAAVAGGLGAAALLGSGAASYQQGKYNAELMENQAKATRRAQLYNETLQRRQFETLLASNRARVGASGIEMSGSPLMVEIGNIYEFENELLAQRYNANIQAQKYEGQAELSSMQGQSGLFGYLLSTGSYTASSLLPED